MKPQISAQQIPAHFQQNHQRLLNCLKLGGMQPKTIALYSHGVRRAGAYFDYPYLVLTWRIANAASRVNAKFHCARTPLL